MSIVVPFVSTSTACENARGLRKPEDLFQHFDHVIVGVIFVIQKDYMIERLDLF